MEIKTIYVEDEFLKNATEYNSDNRITIESCDDTLGNVMRWMAAYDEDEFNNKITKDNYRMYHSNDGMNMSKRYEDAVINGGGMLTYFGSHIIKHYCKIGYDADGNRKEYPIETPFIDIVCDYAENHWDDDVHVISYYSGAQGVLINTVFDKKNKNALFTFASLEHYGRYRAR